MLLNALQTKMKSNGSGSIGVKGKMKLSDEAIRDFKRVYRQVYGVEILSDEHVNELGLMLLSFWKLIYRPLPQINPTSNVNKYEQNR